MSSPIPLSNYLLLFFISLSAIKALPVENNASQSKLNAAQRAMLSEYHISQLPPALLLSQKIPKFQRPKQFNLTKIAKEIKAFGINSLKDDPHLEGIPLERDGKINPDFHKELFLGNHELFESEIEHNPEKRNEKLEEIFRRANTDGDQYLSQDELLYYVLKNIEMHLKEAKEKNSQLFILIDSNGDGKITWHEYFLLYTKFHKVNDSLIKESDVFDFVQGPMTNDFQRELLKIRYRWTEADSSDDNELDIDEFLAFRHPEIAGNSYKHIVDELIMRMDRDDDQKLNETEFIAMPESVLEDPTNKEWIEMDRRWVNEQKEEFRQMDENNDGFLSRDELMRAFDPRNRLHITKEIKKLISKIDDSPKDEKLSLDEIKKHASVFTDIRILDIEKALHDEM